MAANRFDELTRALASNTSRRTTLRAIFSGVIGGGLGLIGLSTIQAAGCIPSDKPVTCKHDSDCCSHKCRFTSVGGDFFCA
jgi:hypothetical protein